MSKALQSNAISPRTLITYVALLRGINVGGHATVSMKDLTSCFEKLGFGHVATYINSGNVVFTDIRTSIPELVEHIEDGIKKYCRMDLRVVVKSKSDLAAICKRLPDEWVTDKSMRTEVMFLRHEVDKPGVVSKIPCNPEVDRLLRARGAIIWNVDRNNYGKSRVPRLMGTDLYKNMTGRNANTTRRLLELMSALEHQEPPPRRRRIREPGM